MITKLTRRALLAAALVPAVAHADAALPVVASFSILADFVRQIGGDAVAVTSLVPPDGDPHVFQPRPADLGRLKSAAVMVENGLGLEGWLARAVQAAGFRGVRITAGAGLGVSRGGAPDPHVWQDPRRASRMVAAIGDGLARADAPRADRYRTAATAYATRILALDADIERRFAAVPAGRRRIITTHDAFNYYGARYGVTVLAAQGISTEAEPSPRGLARLAAQIREQGIRTVFLENMTDPRIATALAREGGATVGSKLYSDSLSPPDGPASTYLDLIRYNTDQFITSMG